MLVKSYTFKYYINGLSQRLHSEKHKSSVEFGPTALRANRQSNFAQLPFLTRPTLGDELPPLKGIESCEEGGSIPTGGAGYTGVQVGAISQSSAQVLHFGYFVE